jgi:hypothetical protein
MISVTRLDTLARVSRGLAGSIEGKTRYRTSR